VRRCSNNRMQLKAAIIYSNDSMADAKKKSQGTDRRKYRSDGTPLWSKRTIDGPGIWVTCVKGKEKQTVGELYDLFESLSAEMWPGVRERNGSDNEDDHDETASDEDGDLSIETRIAKEIAVIQRPRREQLFANCQTNTPCVIFISCKSPIDPVKLVATHVENVQKTGVTRTRYTHRLIPVSDTCLANIPEMKSLCRRIFALFFAKDTEKKYSYKIDLRVRNHNTLPRPTIIQEVASCVPEGHTVDLENPEVFILVEVFKSVCGISIVQDYYRFQKFNVMEIANARHMEGNFRQVEAHA